MPRPLETARYPMTTGVLQQEPVTNEPTRGAPKPLVEGKQPLGIFIGLWAFVVVPFIALIVSIPLAWGGALTWTDVAIGGFFYVLSGLGVTVGYHRYLTHGSFKAKRWLRVTLAFTGALAIQGSPTQWVADHRRHHTFSDVEGDPHSPWRFHREMSNRARFAPDLLADRDIQRIDKLFGPIVAASILTPALIGGLVT